MTKSICQKENLENAKNISFKDREALSSALNDIFSNPSAGVIRIQCNFFNRLLQFLDEEDSVELSEWDIGNVADFLTWTNWSPSIRKRSLPWLNSVLKKADNNLDCRRVKIDEGEIILQKIYPTFNLFNSKVESVLQSKYKGLSPDVITKLSTPQAILYLAWLGIPARDALKIKRKDTNIKECHILFCGRSYQYADNTVISKFLEKYYNANSYTFIDGSLFGQIHSFTNSEYLIKQAKQGECRSVSNIYKNIRENFNISVDAVWYSGRFDSLYKYEANAGIVTENNLSEISEYLGLKATSSKTMSYTNTLSIIMRTYPKYKMLRQSM